MTTTLAKILRQPLAQWIMMCCLLGASAPPALAAAHYVYHERTLGDVTGGVQDTTCTGNRSFVPVITPLDSQSYTLRFKVEYQFSSDQARVYYTTDGNDPVGSLGNASNTTQVISASYTCLFTFEGNVIDICSATIPTQAAGTTVKYIVSTWHTSGGAEIFGNSGTCGSCDSFTNSAQATVFQYSVPVAPSLTAQPASLIVTQGQTAAFSVSATGTAPLLYQWLFNAGEISDATNAMLSILNAQPADAASYTVLVSNAAGAVTSAVATLTVLVPAAIVAQPASLIVTQGQTAAFSVSATGTAPLLYQWLFNAGELSDATNAMLSILNAQPADAGSYTVLVSNAAGAVTSAVATLTVLVPAAIVAQPASLIVTQGQTAAFSVSATGTAPLLYQWLFNAGEISGATNAMLSILNAQPADAGSYTVLVSNAAGAVTSAVATLTVLVPAAIVAQPASLIVTQGQTAAFSVSATGTAPLLYQWLFNAGEISGATNAMLSILNAQPADAGSYTVLVSNAAGAVTSAVATLTVLVPAAIVAQPVDRIGIQGQTTTFSVSATGTAPLLYQWRFNTGALAGATNATLSIPNTQPADAGSYTVLVSNAAGAVTSVVATLTVIVPVAIVAQPVSRIVIQGQMATFSVSVTGTAPLLYQWRFNAGALAGATNATLSIPNTQPADAGSYTVLVSNAAGAVTSSAATLTVRVPATIVAQPASLIVTQGQTAAFSVGATGTAPLLYQWRLNAANLVGATNSTLSVPNAQPADAGGYAVLVSNSLRSVTSVVATLTVLIPAAIAMQPASLVVTQGQTAAFNVSATGTAPLSYQWHFNTGALAGATNATLSIPNTQPADTGSYTVLVSNAAGAVTSAVASLTVLGPAAIVAQPASLIVTQGQTAAFSVSATGDAPLLYQWRFNAGPLAGATNATLSIPNAQPADAGSYTVFVSNAAGAVTSVVATLTVLVPAAIVAQPASLIVTQGQTAAFSVSATGTAPLLYQWRFNASELSGETNATLSIPNAQPADAGSYTVLVSNAAGAVTSIVATLTVLVPAAIVAQPASLIVTQGQTALFSVSATGTAPLLYQWLFNAGELSGATNATLSIPNAQPADAGSYTVLVSNAAGAVTSIVATLTVLVPAAIVAQPASLIVTQGQTAAFSVNATGTAPLLYQWLFNAGAISGATNATLSILNAQPADAGSYTVLVSNAAGAVTSIVATLTVLVPAAIVAQPASLIVTQGQTALFSVSATGTAPLLYQWLFNAGELSGATNATLSIPNAQPADAGSYTVLVSNAAGAVTSIVATLTVLVPAAIVAQPASLIVTQGQTAAFSVNATGTAPLLYQWLFNAGAISGATNATLSILNAQPADAGSYTVLVSNAAEAVTSVVATLTVLVPAAIVAQPASLIVTQGQTALFSVSATGTAPLLYQWLFNAGELSGATNATLSIPNAQPADAGSYTVLVSNAAGAVTSIVATLTVLVPAAIVAQPASLIVTQGQTAAFSVSATGTAPLLYQWLFNAGAISGATNATLSIPNAQPADAGSYTVLVSNAAGAVTSAVATLTVLVPAAILAQPASLIVTQGQTALFSVSATGTAPLQYQWRFNAGALAGATNATLSIPNAQPVDAGNYTVFVSNAAGAVTSAVATLTVQNPLTITLQPRSRVVLVGASYTFTVAAAGAAPLHYQWLFNGIQMAGQTNSSLSLSNLQVNNSGAYRAIVSNFAAATNSTDAQLAVRTTNDPAYVTPAGNWAYLYSGHDVSNPVSAALDGTWNRPSSADSWSGDGRGAGQGLPGGVSSTNGILTLEDAVTAGSSSTDNRRYYFTHSLHQDATVTNADTILNDGVTISFRARLTPPTDVLLELTNAPNGGVNQSGGKGMFGLKQAGGSGQIISFSLNGAVEDTGLASTFNFGQPALHLNSLNGDTRTAAVDPGAGTLNLLPLDPTAFHEFWITIQDNSAAPGTHAVSIYVDGSKTPTVFHVTAGTGTDGPATNYLALAMPGTAPRGAFDLDYIAYKPGVLTPYNFNDPLGFTQIPASQLLSVGMTASFSVGVTGAPPYLYQWLRNGTAIPGATNDSYTTPPVAPPDNNAAYVVIVNNGFDSITSSPPAIITLPIPPTIATQPQSLIVTNGDSAQFSVGATGGGTLSYQWQFNGANLPGANTPVLAIANSAPTNAGNYRAIISNLGGSVTSTVATLTVQGQDFGDAPAPYPTRLVNNGARHLLVADVQLGLAADVELDGQPDPTATGDDLNGTDDEDGVTFTNPLRVGQLATVQVVASTNGLLNAWLDFNADASWGGTGEQIFTNRVLVAGTNVVSFRVAPSAAAGDTFARFRFSTTGGLSFTGPAADGEVEDHAVTLVPVADLALTLADAPAPVAVGSNLTYTLTVTNLGPSSASAIRLTNTLPGGVLFVSATPSQGSCTPSGGTVSCHLSNLNSGASATVVIVVTPGGTGPLVNTANVASGETDLNPTNNPATATTTVLNPPFITAQPQGRIVTNGSSVTLSVTATGAAPLRYQWRRDGADLNGETNATLVQNNVQAAQAGSYTVRVSNEVGAQFSAAAPLTVLVPPAITAQPQSRTNLAGSTASFTVTVTGTAPLQYQWIFNGTNALAGATNATLALLNVQRTNAGSYRVEASNSAGVVASETVTLSVMEIDFGDAPDPAFPTRLVSDGARHRLGTGLVLGARVDFEPDGQPNAAATGDDGSGPNDEDGVTFNSLLLFGQTTTLAVVASTNGLLDAWIDWDRNGSWAGAGEQIFTSRPLVPGANLLQVTVPLNAAAGASQARFRFSSTGGLAFTGEAPDGEVEDYAVSINAAVDLILTASAQPAPAVVGSNLVYTLAVTNSGPSSASVTLTNVLPEGVTLISTLASQGSCAEAGGILSCDLGRLSSNRHAVVTVTVTPPAAGALTNQVIVRASETDLNPANNTSHLILDALVFPALTAQPQSLTRTNGDSAGLSVTATGTALSYQWLQNGVEVNGATSSVLVISNVQANHAGVYAVRVGNAVGSILSSPATLTVLVPATITAPPQAQVVIAGLTATFSVSALGTQPLHYQWQFNGFDLNGETAPTLVIPNAQPVQEGRYTVRVENFVRTVESSPATLTVLVPPALTSQPQSRTNFAGGPATFSVTVVGTAPLRYQWHFNQTNDLSGATNATLTLNNVQRAHIGNYAVTVTNGAGTVTSTEAVLAVVEGDFGDAPDALGYPTLLAFNGARHLLQSGVHLGGGVDFEPDGQPNAPATGDDLGGADDEDGVTFTSPLLVGQPATISVVASTNGFLEAWLDFNANGQWADAQEQIFTSLPLVAGVNNLTFTVPPSAVASATFARFRFSTVGGLLEDGLAPNGEVEDYSVAVGLAIDLVAGLLDEPDPVAAGSDVTYFISVTNLGPSSATGVRVTDGLPFGMNLVSAVGSQGSCSNAAGTIICDVGTLASGEGAVVTLVATANRSGTFTNTAHVAANEVEVLPLDNTASQTTSVTLPPLDFIAPAPIAIADANEFGPGLASLYPSTLIVSGFTSTVYQVTVSLSGVAHSFPADLDFLLVGPGGQTVLLMSDCGASPISGVTITLDDSANRNLPSSGTIFDGVYQPSDYGPLAGPAADLFPPPAPPRPWASALSALQGLNPNGTWALYVLDDAPEDSGSIDGGWSLKLTTADPFTDLALAAQATPTPVGTGSNLTYTLTVTNQGPSSATGVTLNNTLPPGVSFVSASASQGICSNAGGTVTCAMGDLALDGGAVATIVVARLAEGIFTNVFTVGGLEVDLHPGNNTATTATPVTAVIDLAVAASGAPDPVIAGQLVTYSISVTNRSANVAHQVRLHDALPANVSFVSATTSLGSGCTNVGSVVDCDLGTLTAGGSATVTLVARPTAPGRLTNSLVVTGAEADYETANNVANAVVTVSPAADLAIGVVDTPDPIALGQNLTYAITIWNQGPNPAAGLQFSNVLSKGVVFVSATPSQGGCTNSSGLVSCALGSLAHGATAMVTIVVAPAGLGLVTNSASVTSASSDPYLTNNSATVVTTVTPAADLALAMIDAPAPVLVNETLTYTLTLTNRGPNPATGVVISDPLPGGVTFLSALASQGSCVLTGRTVVCTLGAMVNGANASVTVAVRPDQTGLLTNSANVSASEADLVSANNDAARVTPVVVAATHFANTGAITINDFASATPYPSSIFVSGLTATVYKVTVTLSNLNHSFPDDIDVLLVSPGGQAVLILSDVGGSTPLVNVTLTLDDTAFAPLPDSDPIYTGHYRPSENAPEGDFFPPPAPVGPHGLTLAEFYGTNPNGTWSLYVADDAEQDAGVLANGWSLAITTIEPIADVSVTMIGQPDPLAVNSNLLYTLTVTNLGPAGATGVRLTNALPPGVNFISATASQGGCVNHSGVVICALGPLTANASAIVTLQVVPTAAGSMTHLAVVASDSRDLISSNNAATQVTVVGEPPTITTPPQTQDVVDGTTVTFSVVATGFGTLHYQWQRDGANLPGATNTTLILSNVTPSDIAAYTVRIENGIAATDSAPAPLLVRVRPTISPLVALAVDEDTAALPRMFTVGDYETPAEALVVSAVSSNPTLVPNANIILGGGGSNRTVILIPATNQFGDATITLTVTDGQGLAASNSFVLTVRPVNDLPTLSALPAPAMDEDATLLVLLTVGDAETAASNLVVTATSADLSLLPNAGLVLTGTEGTRTLAVTPGTNQFGAANITITVIDGHSGSTSGSFLMTVHPINDAPTLNSMTNIVINEDSGAGVVALSGLTAGATNEFQTLTVTAVSLNPGLIPDPSVSYTSPNSTGSLVFAPLTNQSGTATIRVTVDDGASQNNQILRTFTVTVASVNDQPVISEIADQQTLEDTATAVTFTVSDVETAATNLTLAGVSSNTNLVPDANIVFGGSGGSRTAVITPATNQSGTTTITLAVADGEGGVEFDSFVLTVTPLDDPPFIASIPNPFTSEDTPVVVPFTAGDVDGGPGGLTVSAVSSNGTLLPNGNIVTAGPGTNGTLTLTPATNEFGTTTITVTVTDTNGASSSSHFTLTVIAVNDAPSLNPLPNLTFNEDAEAQIVALAGLTAGPANEPATLTVTASSSDTNLIAHPSVTYASPNATGALTFAPRPNVSGVATISVSVNDNGGSNNVSTRSFTVTVNSVNDLPVLSDIPNAAANEDTPITLAFTIGDIETPAGSLGLAAVSSNPNLIAAANVVFGGSGSNRTVTVTPPTNLFGTATITVAVTDTNGASASDSFLVTFNAVNDAPTLGALTNLTLLEDAGGQTVALNGISSGASNEAQALFLTATSSNPSLIPDPLVVYSSSNSTGSLTFAPLTNANGTATITVTVDDLGSSNNFVTRTFTVAVTPVNDPPVISDIVNQGTGEDTPLGLTFQVGDVESAAASLAVAGRSSDTNLVPEAAFVFGGSGAVRTLVITPAPNRSGPVTLTVTVTDPNGGSASDTFTLTVLPVNDPPVISGLTNQTINEDTATAALAFTVSDVENSATDLAVTSGSSNPNLLPNANIVLTGTGASRTVTFTPAPNQFGAATITLTVADTNGASSTSAFLLTVNPVNDPPTLAALTNLTINEDAAPQLVTLSGISSGAANELQLLTVTASSSNPSLIPNPSIAYATPDATGTLTFNALANASGTATITVTVNDGSASNNILSRTFTVTVNAVNDPPAISDLQDTATSEDTPKSIAFTVGDVETPAANLLVAGISSNTNLVPSASMVFSGSGSNRTVTVTPATNQTGTATITVTVTDPNSASASDTFLFTVNPVNEPPTISAIPSQVTSEDIATAAIAFSVGDLETPSASLAVTASSSNPALVGNANIVLGGSGANRTVTITPTMNLAGAATITLTVRDADGGAVASAFVLTVNAVNDPPTISPLTAATTAGTTPVSMPFTVADFETPAGSLGVTGDSSNPALIPGANIVLSSSGGGRRTVAVTAASSQTGSATITLIVTDGNGASATNSFTVTVNAANLPPTITGQPQSQTVSNGNTVAFNVAVAGTAPFSYQWRFNGADLAGATNAGLTLLNVQSANAGSYQVVAANPFGLTSSALAVLTVNVVPLPPVLSMIATGAVWKYLDTGTNLGTNWIRADFNDAAWASGPAQLGYGDGDEATVVGFGPDANNKFITTYFRRSFVVGDPSVFSSLTVALKRDDGAIVYLNGVEVFRDNMPAGPVSHLTQATASAPDDGASFLTNAVSLPLLLAGTNVVAVEIHQSSLTSTDLSVDLALFGNTRDLIRPTIASVPPQVTNEDTPLTVPLIISSPTTSAFRLAVTAASTNANLLPLTNIFFVGHGTNRTLTMVPATNQFGTSLVTLTVSDGPASNSTTFLLTVNAVNDPPTLNSLADLALVQNPANQVVNLAGISSGAANESQTLTVTVASSNPTLVPLPSVTYTSPSATGSLTINPANSGTGASVLSVTVSDGSTTVTQAFTLRIRLSTTALPTISAVVNQVVNEDTATGPLAFTVGDAATPVANLGVLASSSNPNLVPNANLVLGGSGASRTVNVIPATNQSGTAVITLTVTNAASGAATTSFVVTVNPVNDLPVISTLALQTINEEGATGVLPFTVGDVETPADRLTVTASSSNPALVPAGNIVLGGSGATRALVITPTTNQSGAATITLTVADGNGGSNSTSFVVNVNDLNDLPAISSFTDQTLNEEGATAALAFTIGDLETAAASLTLNGGSSNPTLLPSANIVFGGSGSNRTVTLTPATNQFGTAFVSITVADGNGGTAASLFVLTVSSVNDGPTLDAIGNLVLNQNAPVQTVNLGGLSMGAANENQLVAVSASSSNPGLVPNPVVNYTSPNPTGVLTLNPTPSSNGTATITVTVSDGQSLNGLATRTFTVTIRAAPVISQVADQSLDEDGATSALAFTLGDVDTAAASLLVTASSSNPALVPAGNITLGGSGTDRTVSVRPGTNTFGVTTITITVADGDGNSVNDSFVVVVNPVNDAPTLNAPGDLVVSQNGGPQVVNLSGISSGAANEAQTLRVVAQSSNPGLIPPPVVNYTSPLAGGLLTFTPAANASGSTTIAITVNDGQAQNGTVTRSFNVTVNSANTPPSISDIPNQTTEEDTLKTTGFIVGDLETAAGSLALSVLSSNTNLVPTANLLFSGSGASRALILTPATNQSGTATITVTVSDGQGGTVSDSFVVTVNPVNDLPGISHIVNHTINEDGATGPLAFTVGDVETAAGSLTLAASSSNTNLVPGTSVVFGGSGSNRTVTVTPLLRQSGSAIITLTVADGDGGTAIDSFLLTVNAVDDLPTLSDIVNQTINEDNPTPIISFTVGDVETLATNLTVTGSSSNPSLVPNANIVFNGSGSARTLRVTPATNQSGTATITVTVTDAGENTASDTFVVTVIPVIDAPVMSDVPDQATDEDTAKAIAFTVGAVDMSASLLTVSAVSSNPGLVPNVNLIPGGSGATRTLTMQPATNQFGTATITVTVTATNGATASDTFVLTVNRLNDDPPVITSQPVGRTVTVGASASFGVAATSQAGPVTWQWRRHGANLTGKTNAILVIVGVQLSDAGDYTALGSNNEGTVSSSIATLRVLVSPVITQIARTATMAHISFTTAGGLNYTVEFKDALSNPAWSALSPVPGTGAILTVTDETATTSVRFYRVRAD